MSLPERLESNAWTGQGSAAQEATRETAIWAARTERARGGDLFPSSPADPWDWRHPDVGWGLVLPDAPDVDAASRARARDAPEPIRRLVAARGDPAPVLRWSAGGAVGHLHRDHADGTREALPLVGRSWGTAPGRFPRYLLIHAAPDVIPWRVQHLLQSVCFTGRLDLEGEALDRYVTVLLEGWPGSAADPRRTVVWTVDSDAEDITRLMRTSLADPVAHRVHADGDVALAYLGSGDGLGSRGPARAGGLLEALEETRPGFVLTTSHGLAAPLDDPAALRSGVGLPVDVEGEALALDAVADGLADGAVWYAQACCSAGTDAPSAYEGAVASGGAVHRTLRAIAGAGSTVAPLARRLLGGPKPIRAFVGHVEPTFDWTLRHPKTGELLTETTVEALWDRLYLFRPVAWALERCHRHGLELELLHREARERFDDGEDTRAEMLAARLTAQDRRSLVILGDPTVALRPPG